MSVKRSSSTDLMYPLKKRAVIEHTKLYTTDDNVTNGLCLDTTGCYDNKQSVNSTGCYDNKQSVNSTGCYDNKQSVSSTVCYNNKQSYSTAGKEQNSSIPTESDLLCSSPNEPADTHLTVARETSPVSEHSPPDYQTPERIPLTSRNINRQISKPLFPFNDNESLISNIKHVNHSNIPNWTKLDYSNHGDRTTRPNIPHSVESIVENSQLTYSSRLKTAELLTYHRCDNEVHVDNKKITVDNVEASQTVSSSPMVSLLSKFNAEQSNSTQKSNPDCDTSKLDCNKIAVQIREVCDQNQEVRGANREVPVPNRTLSVQRDLSTFPNSGNLGATADLVNKTACKLCGMTFPSQSQLIHHAKEHRGIIRCWKCSEEFASTERLNLHMKMTHKGENAYKCETCSREFTQYNNLRRHQRVHRENLYKCNLCDREFNEEFYLKMHMGTHTGSRVYSCGVCRAEFPSNHDLKMHVKTHSPSLLHTCNVCGKSFSKACVLRQHKKCHSGQRPHKCTVCDKTFIHRHHLTMHMKSHTEEERKAAQNMESASRDNNHSRVDEITNVETDPNSLKEMNKENIKPDFGSTTSSQKPNIKCNKNLAKQFVNIPQNPHADKIDVVKKKTSHKRGRKKSAAEISELAQFNGHTQPIYREAVSGGYMPNTTYAYHPSQQTQHTSRPLQHTAHTSHSMIPPMFPASVNQYGHLYKHYSEQMQAYMNNMYMMSYLSQNAMLPSFQGQGHLGLQGEGHKLYQGQSQLPTGNNLQLRDQCYSTTPLGYQRQLPQGQGQQSSVEGHQSSVEGQQSSGQGQIKIEDQVVSKMNEQRIESDAEKCEDVKPCESTLEDSTGCFEVVSKNENIEVYVFKGNDVDNEEDAFKTSIEDNVNSKFIDKSDEHEIAEEMIKMSAGVWPGTVLKKEGTNLAVEGQGTADVSDNINLDIDEPSGKTSEPTCSTNVSPRDSELVTVSEFMENERDINVLENCVENSLLLLKHSHETEKCLCEVSEGGDCDSIDVLPKEVNEVIPSCSTKHEDKCTVNKLTDVETTSKQNDRETDISMNAVGFEGLKPNHEDDKQFIDSENKHNASPDILNEVCREIKVEVNVVESELEVVKVAPKAKLTEITALEKEKCKYENYRSKLVNKRHGETNRVEFNGRFNDVNQSREMSDDHSEQVPHGNVDTLEHKSDVNETEAIDLRTKLRCEDDVTAITDENSCVPLNLKVKRKFKSPRKLNSPKKLKSPRNSKSPRKSNSPRDFYVIKRSDALKDCSESFDGMRQYCSICRQTYIMEAREFQYHLKAHDEERLNETKVKRENLETKWENCGSKWENSNLSKCENWLTKWEKSGKDSMNGGRNRNKSSPARCVLKPMDMNSPPHDRLYTGKWKNSPPHDRLYTGKWKNSPPHDRLYTGKWKANDAEDVLMSYKCPDCSRSFAHKHNLTRHQMCHNTKAYGCEVCGRHFKEQFYLQMHMKVHNEETKRQCDVCGQNVLKSEFVNHTKEHFRCIAENPTYTQISDRVRELLHVQKSSQQAINNELFLYDQITNIPNMKGSLDELAQLMTLTKSNLIPGVIPLDNM